MFRISGCGVVQVPPGDLACLENKKLKERKVMKAKVIKAKIRKMKNYKTKG
jgi:hypothetical protein